MMRHRATRHGEHDGATVNKGEQPSLTTTMGRCLSWIDNSTFGKHSERKETHGRETGRRKWGARGMNARSVVKKMKAKTTVIAARDGHLPRHNLSVSGPRMSWRTRKLR